MVEEINILMEEQQSEENLLSECRGDLDVLIDMIAGHKHDEKSLLYKCEIRSKDIRKYAAIVQNPMLDLVVLIMQVRHLSELS